MILLLDNYDSFVYNLDRYLQCLGQSTFVIRSDAIGIEGIQKLGCRAIVVSPGPKTPDEAGVSLEVIRRLSETIPILGVCLGHQAIGQAFGAKIVRGPRPVHGLADWVERTGESRLLDGLPHRFQAARYHSLVIDPDALPDMLRVTARTEDELIMAVEHKTRPLFGVQFHPESVLSRVGIEILANFLRAANLPVPSRLPPGDWRDADDAARGLRWQRTDAMQGN